MKNMKRQTGVIDLGFLPILGLLALMLTVSTEEPKEPETIDELSQQIEAEIKVEKGEK